MKKLPWTSLALLLVAYSTFGWLLHSSTLSWQVWLIAVVCILLKALALTSPLKTLRTCFAGMVKSDTRAFIFLLIGVFIAVVLFTWFEVFVHVLLLLSAGLLARLDIHSFGFSGWQAFGIMAVVSLAGLGLGLLIHLL